jgi:hypothetical protein
MGGTFAGGIREKHDWFMIHYSATTGNRQPGGGRKRPKAMERMRSAKKCASLPAKASFFLENMQE